MSTSVTHNRISNARYRNEACEVNSLVRPVRPVRPNFPGDKRSGGNVFLSWLVLKSHGYRADCYCLRQFESAARSC